MRNKANVAVAVRQEKGNIFVQKMQFHSISERYPLLKWPLFRGVVAFVEALVLGYRTLTLSAEQVLEGEEEELKGWELPLTMIISLAAGIGLFILLPTVLMKYLSQGLEIPILLNLCEGLLRLLIFLGDILAISCWKEVRRVFEYHGVNTRPLPVLRRVSL